MGPQERIAKLTKAVVDNSRPADRRYIVWDRDLKGFGLRVEPSGVKSYLARYRAGGGRAGTLRQVTIGRHGPFTVDQARKEAGNILNAAARGADPAVARAKARDEMTVAELCDLYLREGCTTKKASTVATDRGRIERHIKPLLGRKKVSEVTGIDVERMLADIAAGKTRADVKTRRQGRAIVRGGRGAATRTVGLLGGIFTFAMAPGRRLRADNPVQRVKRFPDRKMERFLSVEELERLGAAIRLAEADGLPRKPRQDARAPKADVRDTVSEHAAGALRLLLFTGARVGEILSLRWDRVDFERRELRLRDSKSGPKVILLNAPALAALASLPRIEGNPHVFPGAKEGEPLADLKRPWAAVRGHAKLDGVRLHDLRHTFASYGAGANLGLPIIGKLLGHADVKTTSRYAHLADDPVRRASDAIGGAIAAILGERSTTGIAG